MSQDPGKAPPEVLDYGIEEPRKLRVRDSAEYYREPPALSRLTTSDMLIWLISCLTALGLLVWLVIVAMSGLR